MKLFFQAITKFTTGVILTFLLLFLPAGTFSYTNGWILIGILFVPMFIAGIVMLVKNPDLLRRRLSAKEKQKEQGVILKLSAVMFVTGFIIAGLDFRYSWSHVPKSVVTTSLVIFLIAYLLYAEVMRENTYLSRTVEVQENQVVIDTGLYSIVRHPMYTSTLLLFLTMPIILGSWWSFAVFLPYPFIIANRIRHEEAYLEKELVGYTEYKKKVKYKLIPFLW